MVVKFNRSVAIGDFVENGGGFLTCDIHRIVIFRQGDVVFDLVKNDQLDDEYIIQVSEMAELAKRHGLNIDYFPTNFVIQNEKLYYIDYE